MRSRATLRVPSGGWLLPLALGLGVLAGAPVPPRAQAAPRTEADALAAIRAATGPGATIKGGLWKIAQDLGQTVVVALYHEKQDGLRVGRFEQIKNRWRPVWQSDDLSALLATGKPQQLDADGDGKADFVFEGCGKGGCCGGFARVVMPKGGPAVWLLRYDGKAKPAPEASMEVAPGSPKSRKVYDHLINAGLKRGASCGGAAQSAIKRVPF